MGVISRKLLFNWPKRSEQTLGHGDLRNELIKTLWGSRMTWGMQQKTTPPFAHESWDEEFERSRFQSCFPFIHVTSDGVCYIQAKGR